MSIKQKSNKQRRSVKDQEEMRKFLLIVVLATGALMVLMYFIFK